MSDHLHPLIKDIIDKTVESASPLSYMKLAVGKRVEIHARFDRWMKGDRYGEVLRVHYTKSRGTAYYVVKMDKSGDVVRFCRDDVTIL